MKSIKHRESWHPELWGSCYPRHFEISGIYPSLKELALVLFDAHMEWGSKAKYGCWLLALQRSRGFSRPEHGNYLEGRGVSRCFFDGDDGCVGYSPGGGGWALELGVGLGGVSWGAGTAVDFNSYLGDVHNSLPVQNGTIVNLQGLAVLTLETPQSGDQ